ncbi:MAG TPA: LamG domain-containing protein [Humisphaera sp.]|nr:LamG domain-containing protein [Humisphaera sp.]
MLGVAGLLGNILREGRETLFGFNLATYIVIASVLISAIALNANAGVIRYYRFETNNGTPVSNGQTLTVADDSSGNNLNGTAIGTPQYVTTPFVSPIPQTGAINHFALLGSTGNGVLLSGAVVPILAPSFTVEASFNLTSTNPNTGDVKPILRVEDPSTGTGVLSLELLNLNGTGGTNDLLLVMSNDTLELRSFDLTANTNYFVAATCSGTDVRFYLNGSLVDSTSISPHPNFVPFTGSGAIGAAIGNDVPGDLAFQGDIDEVRISNTVLTPSQFLPEPASLSLFGLVGVVLSRRRRRCAWPPKPSPRRDIMEVRIGLQP